MNEDSFREDGIYEVDFKELDKLKRKNVKDGNLKQFNLTGEQEKFLTEYWYFLTPTQRKSFIGKLFPGKSYGSLQKRIDSMRNSGIKFKQPHTK